MNNKNGCEYDPWLLNLNYNRDSLSVGEMATKLFLKVSSHIFIEMFISAFSLS